MSRPPSAAGRSARAAPRSALPGACTTATRKSDPPPVNTLCAPMDTATTSTMMISEPQNSLRRSWVRTSR
ncbi:hypothetical protein BKA01_001777 [Pseudonocardia eucalypti]|nr:hypothetical protein [Pseudonocardia eucalypti]